MPLLLRPLHPDEFPGYLAYFLPDYAAELVASYGLPVDIAATRAKAEIAADLPQGPLTPGQSLLAVTNPGLIGYLWYAADPASQTAFLNDFHIFPSHQSKGHGTSAINALESLLKSHGLTHLRLRVAASNPRAQSLYLALGFQPTGTNMAKAL